MPTSPGFSRLVLKSVNIVGLSSSPFTGQAQSYLYPGEFWALEATLPPMKRAAAEVWISFLLACRGQSGTFLWGATAFATPRGVGTGTPTTLLAADRLTDISLPTRGWTTNQTGILLAGDMIQVPVNLITAPEDFEGAPWTLYQCTDAPDSVTSPDGTTDADRITPSGGATDALVCIPTPGIPCIVGATYTFTVSLRAASGTPSINIAIYNNGFTSAAYTTCNLTTSWQQFSVSYTVPSGTTGLCTAIGGNSSWPVAKGAVDIWGAELTSPKAQSRLYKNLSDTNSDGSGYATFDIFPRLRESPAYYNPIIVNSPKGLFRLTGNQQQIDIDQVQIYGIGFSAIEAL
jgi:hypothetical protein